MGAKRRRVEAGVKAKVPAHGLPLKGIPTFGDLLLQIGHLPLRFGLSRSMLASHFDKTIIFALAAGNRQDQQGNGHHGSRHGSSNRKEAFVAGIQEPVVI